MNKAIILAIILFLAGGGYFIFKNYLVSPQLTPVPTPTSLAQATPTTTPLSDWLTYKNSQYGFEISYPKTYKALDDKDNLYGWPNAATLLYKDGQSYDIAIEIWDNETAYKTKHPQDSLVVKKVGDKFITLFDITKKAENTQIISTFKISSD